MIRLSVNTDAKSLFWAATAVGLGAVGVGALGRFAPKHLARFGKRLVAGGTLTSLGVILLRRRSRTLFAQKDGVVTFNGSQLPIHKIKIWLPLVAAAETDNQQKVAAQLLEEIDRFESAGDLMIAFVESDTGQKFNSSLQSAKKIGQEILAYRAKYSYHGTNSVHAESIVRDGLLHNRPGDRELKGLVKRLGTALTSPFGSASYSTSKIYLSDRLTFVGAAHEYATRSPEWFTFYRSQHYRVRDREQFMGKVRQSCDSISDDGLKQDVLDFFDRKWTLYVDADPVLFVVDISCLKSRLHTYPRTREAEAIARATTTDGVRTILKSLFTNEQDSNWGVEQSFSPDKLKMVTGIPRTWNGTSTSHS